MSDKQTKERIWLLTLAVSALALVALACGETTPSTTEATAVPATTETPQPSHTPTPQPIEVTFDVDAYSVRGKVYVAVNTNLPDGAQFTFELLHNARVSNHDETRVGNGAMLVGPVESIKFVPLTVQS